MLLLDIIIIIIIITIIIIIIIISYLEPYECLQNDLGIK